MRVLIIGANSLLGKALWESFPKESEILLTDLPSRPFKNHQKLQNSPLDITNKNQSSKIIRQFNPNFIIHLAAISNVDFCEKNPNQAFKVNVQGTHHILSAAKKIKTKIIFTSSNGVFDGNKAPYSERHKPKPIHTYGKTKLQAENLIRKSKTPWIITRLITMYGWPPKGARQNPVTWTLEKLKNKKTLHMVNDNFINPLFAPSAADAIWQLITNNKSGLFHIAGKTRVNRYQWTKQEAQIFGFNTALINQVTSKYIPNLTPRPKDTSFSTSKIQKTINWKPLTLKQGLITMHQVSN